MAKRNLDKFINKSREAAAEGAVLLRNEKNTLPLDKNEVVSVFGRPMFDYYRSGTGSGGAVTVPYAVNLLEGIRNSGLKINEDIINDYEEWLKDNPFNNGGGGWAQEPWHQHDMEITEDYAKEQARKTKKAIYVVGRTAGEDKDNYIGEGSYLLTEKESNNIKNIAKAFDEVIVLLNTSNIIDMKWAIDPETQDSITAIVYVWQGGMEGGNAVMDVLLGKVNPSGKLSDTITYDIMDYPSTYNFGNDFRNYYKEDIYVGYRYFETFAPHKVMYEFGFGLSYTTFDIITEEVQYGVDETVFKIDVTNTGNVAGKEVVQIYLEAPQGKLGKSKKALVGFAKTKELKPNKTQTLEIVVPKEVMASYDDRGLTGHKSCYVLEAGKYQFHVGNSVKNCSVVSIFEQEELEVVEECSECLCPDDENLEVLTTGDSKGDIYDEKWIPSMKPTVDLALRIENNLPKSMEITGDKGIKLQDVHKGKASMDDFVAQLSVEDMACLVRGEGMSSPRVTDSTASAFGGLSDSLFKFGIPVGCCADGPSGLRMKDDTVQLPIGTLLACTWNTELIKELYTFEGKELVNHKVDTLLGPGVNIHRSPLNGRNFEYYSEDPFLAGKMAVACTGGIKAGGSWGTIKHFALNSQEASRFKIDAVASERAIREIYLKPFEMAVKAGTIKTLMTAYNPVNGHWSASNYDLCTTILRGEWGFDGMVMTDWWARMNDVVKGGEESAQFTRDMIRSQNDAYMIVNNNGAEVNSHGDNTVKSVEEGRLTIGELQRASKNILNFLINATVIERELVDTDVPKDCPVDPDATPKYKEFTINGNDKVEFDSEKYATMNVTESGTYTLIVNMCFDSHNLYQATLKMNTDKGNVLTLQTAGTDGYWVTQKVCKLNLEKGVYNIELEDVQAGIKVAWMQFKK